MSVPSAERAGSAPGGERSARARTEARRPSTTAPGGAVGPCGQGRHGGRAAFAAQVGAGLLTAAVTAALLPAIGPEDAPYGLTAVVPTAPTGLFLLIATGGGR
ncbi:hypothetical protein WJM95_16915 [Streptomyces sp. f51]|uniref:hypothetical protein n=1 Tax=Streptomyces sp. f51 TaxID=1827742 RepID=UPI0030D2996A